MNKKKKWFALAMAFVMVVTSFNLANFATVTASAEETGSESTDEPCVWSFDDANGKLTVTLKL